MFGSMLWKLSRNVQMLDQKKEIKKKSEENIISCKKKMMPFRPFHTKLSKKKDCLTFFLCDKRVSEMESCNSYQ